MLEVGAFTRRGATSTSGPGTRWRRSKLSAERSCRCTGARSLWPSRLGPAGGACWNSGRSGAPTSSCLGWEPSAGPGHPLAMVACRGRAGAQTRPSARARGAVVTEASAWPLDQLRQRGGELNAREPVVADLRGISADEVRSRWSRSCVVRERLLPPGVVSVVLSRRTGRHRATPSSSSQNSPRVPEATGVSRVPVG